MRIWTLAAHHEHLAITISVLAFLVSAFSLSWNIYRDVILKARLRVSFNLGQFRHASGLDKRRLWFSAVNLGPGDITIEMAVAKMQPALLAWLRKEEGLRLAVHEFKNELDAQLPIKLVAAEKMMISFPIEENCILDQHPLRIGLRDAYGRAHWVPVKDLKKAQRDHSEYKASRVKRDTNRSD